MSQWALPAIAVMLIAYGAVSGRLRSTPVSQAMVFVALGHLVGNRSWTWLMACSKNRRAALASRCEDRNTSMTCPNWSIAR
jgi:hypothetical protein